MIKHDSKTIYHYLYRYYILYTTTQRVQEYQRVWIAIAITISIAIASATPVVYTLAVTLVISITHGVLYQFPGS